MTVDYLPARQGDRNGSHRHKRDNQKAGVDKTQKSITIDGRSYTGGQLLRKCNDPSRMTNGGDYVFFGAYLTPATRYADGVLRSFGSCTACDVDNADCIAVRLDRGEVQVLVSADTNGEG